MNATTRRLLSALAVLVTMTVGGNVAAAVVLGASGHNGFNLLGYASTDVHSIPASGAVEVYLGCDPFDPGQLGPAPGEQCVKRFDEIAVHELVWEAPQGTLLETVVNNTGIPFTDYHFEFLFPDVNGGTSGAGLSTISNSITLTILNPDLDASSAVVNVSPGFVSLDFDFLSPIPQGGTTEFTVAFELPGAPVTIRQFPTVPEPTTLALLCMGLAGVGLSRRKQ